MFSHLTDFSYHRTPQQAIGFYIAYLILIVLCGGVIGGVMGILIGDFTTNPLYIRILSLVPIGFCIGLAYLILKKKNMFGNYQSLLLAVLAAFLAYFGGAVLGLIPIAYLTTKK